MDPILGTTALTWNLESPGSCLSLGTVDSRVRLRCRLVADDMAVSLN